MALLSLQNITLNLGHGPLLDGINFQVERGERVCLVGRNGAGKSSLLKVIIGDLAPNEGNVILSKGAQIARLPQEVPQEVEGTVFEVISAGGADGHPAPDYEVEAVISKLQLVPDAPFSTLSGGLRRRAWLGRVLVGQPDILLLDEPTNHLDIDSITWLEEFLLRYVKTLLFVTHDRAFLRRLATRIVEIDRGDLLNWECDYDTYLVRKEAALEAESKQRALFDKRLAQEEVWVRRGVEARRTKSLSRIRALIEMREERTRRRERIGMVGLKLQDASRSGKLVVEAENVQFGYAGELVVRDFSTLIMRGDKVGIIGANGTGKTTLLKLLLGQLEPQEGTIRLGTNMQVAFFDQLREQLEEEKSVQYNVCGENSTVRFNGEDRHIVGYLQEFLFSGERARTPVKFLSGGERNRLLLAKLFTQPANVLVMDEPTNDLDAETLELLENLLVEFTGTLLLVSHDRAFLNDVVTSSIVFEADADGVIQINEYVGGYDDWIRQRPRLAAPVAASNSVPKLAKAPAVKVRKMGQKERLELQGLPAQLEALEQEQSALVERMADPAFYQGNASEVKAATERLAIVQAEAHTKFERWEKLLALETEAG